METAAVPTETKVSATKVAFRTSLGGVITATRVPVGETERYYNTKRWSFEEYVEEAQRKSKSNNPDKFRQAALKLPAMPIDMNDKIVNGRLPE